MKSIINKIFDPYSLVDFETYICSFKSRIFNKEILCQVCNRIENSIENEILVCSKCQISMHEKCYGKIVSSYDDWICDPCLIYPDEDRRLFKCCFCPIIGGAIIFFDKELLGNKNKNKNINLLSTDKIEKNNPKRSTDDCKFFNFNSLIESFIM